MPLFPGGGDAPQPDPEGDGPGHRFAVIALLDDIHDHDLGALAKLTRTGEPSSSRRGSGSTSTSTGSGTTRRTVA